MEFLKGISIVALVSVFMGVVPLAMSIVYAIWPTERRLELMRPLSLATIFAAVSGTTMGIINLLKVAAADHAPVWSSRTANGLAESLVPVFFGFGCLTIAWLGVAVGLWRRP
jgi:hypothetical protein